MHSPSQTSTIHSYHTLFSLLAWHPNIFFLNILSHYHFIFSARNLLATTFTIPLHTQPLRNPIILHSLHIAEPPENTFINPFVTLHICTALIIELSFSFHIIVSIVYIRTGTSNISCKTLAHSSCRLLTLTRDLITPATFLPLVTFLWYCCSSVPDSS